MVETPLKEFLANGNTTDFAVYRVNGLDASRASTVLAAARAFLGRPGDFFLDDTQERLYSSELVRLAFARAGVSLGRTDRLRTLARGNKGVEAAFGAKWGCRGASWSACPAAPNCCQPQPWRPEHVRGRQGR